MTTCSRAVPLVLAAAYWLRCACGQPLPVAPPREILLSTQFLIPISYDAALKRVDEYFDQEVNRRSAAAFPRIGPQQHFDLWHDMWVSFENAGDGEKVTIRRAADDTTARLVKGWMLNLAGRMDAAVPLVFKEDSGLHAMEGDLYAATRDVARAVKADASMKVLPTWEHAGLLVSSNSLTSITLAPAGLHGTHRVTVLAETAASAKALWARVQQGASQQGIYSAYSEEAEIAEEIRHAAQGQVDTLSSSESHTIYLPQMSPKMIEDHLRASPEIIKRNTAAQGQYDVCFRIDRPYRKVVVKWSELSGYSRTGGTFQSELPRGQSSLAAPKVTAQAAAHLVARTRLEALKPGAYRITLEGENSAGELLQLDQCTFWFDGKSFEEI